MTTIASVLARRNSHRVDIPVIGDSVTEGQGASQFGNRWVQQLNGIIRTMYPTTANGSAGGLGFIPVASSGETSYTWPVSSTGSVSTANVGPIGAAGLMTSASTWSFTAPAGTTSVKIMYFNTYSGIASGSFSYRVNSGSATPVNSSTAPNPGADGALTSSIPMSGGDTLTIAWVTGIVFIEGVIHYAGDENSGITFHACGHYGWKCTDWLSAGSGFDYRPAFAAMIPDLGCWGQFLGINDGYTGSGDEVASAFLANWESLDSQIRGNATLAPVPLLAIAAYAADLTWADSGGWPAYAAAIGTGAISDGNAQAVNLSAVMPGAASDPGLYTDGIHPDDAGHLLVAQVIAAALASGSGLLMAAGII